MLLLGGRWVLSAALLRRDLHSCRDGDDLHMLENIIAIAGWMKARRLSVLLVRLVGV